MEPAVDAACVLSLGSTMLLGEITVPFVEAAVERMFNADEVTSVVDLAKLECLKREIVSLFLSPIKVTIVKKALAPRKRGRSSR